MAENNRVFVALGANLGKPETAFRAALDAMPARGVEIVAESGVWHSPAWPSGSGAPDYRNMVAEVRTGLGPGELLTLLHGLEAEAGRVRSETNAPRPLDLDLLTFGGVVSSGWPVLPHPRLQSRAFVLLPLAEVAPGWRHPVLGLVAVDMLARLPASHVLRHRRVARGLPSRRSRV